MPLLLGVCAAIARQARRQGAEFPAQKSGRSSRRVGTADTENRTQSNQIKSNYFIVRLKVDQRAGQLSLPHLGITKTEKNRTKT